MFIVRGVLYIFLYHTSYRMKIGILTIIVCLTLGCTALLDSCKPDALPYNTETITTMKVVARNLSTNAVDTFVYINYNETRSNPPFYLDTIRLSANSSYTIQVLLLNQTTNPTITMTDTIIARASTHLMIYNIEPTELFSLKILDKDPQGLPLGLSASWTTTGTRNGWLRMILRQQPGNKNGTDTPGNTNFEADFPVIVR